MTALLDATTLNEYLTGLGTSASAGAQAVIDALDGAGTVTAKVYDGSGNLKASGTMADPWATQSNGVITLAEVTGFQITGAGPVASDWYMRFEAGTRWLRGSFGAVGSGAEITYSGTWAVGAGGELGTITCSAPSNAAPSLVGAPSTLSYDFGVGGSYNFGQHAVDPNGDTLTYSLIGTAYTGITINSSTGVLTVGTNATAATRSLTIRVTDPAGLSSDWGCAVIIAVPTVTHFIIPSDVTIWDASVSQPRVSGGSAIPNSIPNPIIEMSAGTSTTTATAGTRTSKLRIANLRPSTGTATVRNPAAGRLTVQAGSFTFELSGAPQNVVIDGTNGGQTYGIRIRWSGDNTMTSGSLVKFGGQWKNVTLKGVEIDGRWTNFTGASFAGIGILTNDAAVTPGNGRFWEGLRITQCYIHNICGEGMYIGPNWNSGLSQGHDLPVRYVEIDNNIVEWTGRDGLNGKNWWEGPNRIHHNTFRNCGQNTTDPDTQGQRPAVTTGGTAEVYNNVIENVGEVGVECLTFGGPPTGTILDGTYGPYSSFAVEIYNNLIVNCGTVAGRQGDGVLCSGADGIVLFTPSVYNNTIVNCEGYGVNFNRTVGGWARNNVLIGNGLGGVRIGSGGPTQANNKTTGSLTAAYRLTSEDAAVGTIGTDISATDLDGISRSGTASKGAYEYS